ncbi:ABC transporter ATP-binding protein [Conexibacter sp. CPCC 206217]|uniref:ABC transporter ATP-binding protein n=1 Tax=Conexibacter sp. CPCC 206217 TaxID=3064574 RepID=UPI002719861A|nr:ABC transporter ATP-binding protein [Conexibacter sp. CPCC 206217]MDO8212527.1 ABC transporter ATP-binding protein [Conexibacter sp. CPCC 206217]
MRSDAAALSGAGGQSAVQATGGISVDRLSKTYERIVGRELSRTAALADVGFDVAPQEFVSVIGPSGCGKSTVMKIIAGLLAASSGDVRVSGASVTGPGTDRACVFQSPGLMPWKNAVDNVALALEFAGISRAERRRRAAEYVELVGLGEFKQHYPGELSGGMQQRLGIARALAIEPVVLLMDEPFGALDALSRTRMQDELLRIWEQRKKTVLFITHSIDEAVVLSDRVLVMGNGTIAAEVEIDLPRPRSRHELLQDPKTLDLMRRLEDLLDATRGGDA